MVGWRFRFSVEDPVGDMVGEVVGELDGEVDGDRVTLMAGELGLGAGVAE